MQNVKTIEMLLNDELLATETYQKALEELKFPGGQFLSNSFMPIWGDHKAAATSLKEQMVKLGGTLDKSTGTWASWPKLIVEEADLRGKQLAVKALLDGERHCVVGYEAALRTSDISPEVRSLIEKILLPMQQTHIRSLDRVLEATPA